MKEGSKANYRWAVLIWILLEGILKVCTSYRIPFITEGYRSKEVSRGVLTGDIELINKRDE